MQPELEIWLDAHISPVVAKWLTEHFGYNCKSSFVLQLYGKDDMDIYRMAKSSEKFVITLSRDADLVSIIETFGAPPKMIWLSTKNLDNKELYAFLKLHLERCIRLLLQFDVPFIELKY